MSIDPNGITVQDVLDVIGNSSVNMDGLANVRHEPYVKIIEQPASRALRFRYECEGRSAGSLPGINSSTNNRTYPTIQVMNYQGPAVVVVSCVTKDERYPHPHKLVGRESCKKGICTQIITSPDMKISFTSLGIQCVKRRDVEESLRQRKEIRVDPFSTGFNHCSQPNNIDLNVVRLCFQVFLKNADGTFTIPLRPVVSDPIYDKKAMCDLNIMKMSHFSASVSGGTEVILLCDKVAKDDIQVIFFEEKDGKRIWQGEAEFQPTDVHKQVAIAFRTPRYHNENIQQPVPVCVQLRQPSDGRSSEPRPFQFVPLERDPEGLARKKIKVEEGCLDRYLAEHMRGMPGAAIFPTAVPRILSHGVRSKVKTEPSVIPAPNITHTYQSTMSFGSSSFPCGGAAAVAVAPPGVLPPVSLAAVPGTSRSTQDFVPPVQQAGSVKELDDATEKLESLELEPLLEMGVNLSEISDLPVIEPNLSGMFDSTNMDTQQPQVHGQDMQNQFLSEDHLNQLSDIKDQLLALSSLYPENNAAT